VSVPPEARDESVVQLSVMAALVQASTLYVWPPGAFDEPV
jgi:hypothetical protein